MVVHFLVRLKFPNQRLKNGRIEKHQLQARDLLTSTVEDVDVILDWWYWYDTWFMSANHSIPRSLLRSQLAFTFLGSFAWALVASDGHLMHSLCRVLFHLLRPFLLCLGVVFEASQCCSFLRGCIIFDSKKIIKRLDRFLDKESSAGFMLLLGIFMEDIPQTTITFLLEGMDEDGGLQLNGLAAANFLSSLYNALIKVADAYDLRNEVLVPSGPLRTYQGHASQVACLTSINGNKFLSGSFDNKVKLWKLSRWGECLRMFEGHYHYVSCLATLGDGRLFVSGSCDYTIKAWDRSSGRCIQTFEGHALDVLAVAAIDCDRFISGSYDNSIKLWSVSTGECMRTFTGHTDEVCALAYVGKERFVSGSSCGDGSIKLWSLNQDSFIRSFDGNSSITCIASINNDCVISGSTGNAIKMWHLSSGACIRSFQLHTASVTCISVTKDGKTFLSGSVDKTIKLWDASTGECIHSFHGHVSGVTAVEAMANGRFVSGSQDGSIIVWTMGSSAPPIINDATQHENGYTLASD